MSGFKPFDNDDFDRVFMTTTELVDQFVGEQLWTWGKDQYGELGDGTAASKSSPGTTAGGGTNWKQVDGGQNFTAAIKTDGTLWCWGYNSNGELGDGTAASKSSPGTTAGGGTNWKQVACGVQHTAAIKTDGTLWTWGYNNKGQLGDGTTIGKSSPVTVSGGGTNWKQVDVGYRFFAAVKTDGTLWTCGYNYNGQLGDGTAASKSSPGTTAGGGTNWKQVACGYSHFAAIKTDGTLWACGHNLYGQLGDGTSIGRSSPVTTAGGGTNWKSVSANEWFSTGIKTDGTLWVWGNNGNYQLGTTDALQKSSPVTTAGGGTNWKQVSCGGSFLTGIKTDGTLWVWGLNFYGNLGTNNTSTYSSPVTTAGGGTNWKQVSSGSSHTAAIGYQ